MSDLERITARRSELDALANELAKRLQEVEAEQEELGSPGGSCAAWPNRAGPIRRLLRRRLR
ncbi:hypothetical protein [Streptomyces sp. NPDC005760]|uniref:hypothetical protein n=1 Tax=Streptomyces sp. NPDC005760 TaxID=3156718 RepID=UPI003401A8D1